MIELLFKLFLNAKCAAIILGIYIFIVALATFGGGFIIYHFIGKYW